MRVINHEITNKDYMKRILQALILSGSLVFSDTASLEFTSFSGNGDGTGTLSISMKNDIPVGGFQIVLDSSFEGYCLDADSNFINAINENLCIEEDDTNIWNPGFMITGASGGIGRAISLAFSRTNATIHAHYKSNKKEAEKTLQLLSGDNHSLHQADLSDHKDVEAMINNIGNKLSDFFSLFM